jgi:hypothetical protein
MLCPSAFPHRTRTISALPCPAADAFADAASQEETTAGVDYVHIRIQQRNGKKSLTTVQVRRAAAAAAGACCVVESPPPRRVCACCLLLTTTCCCCRCCHQHNKQGLKKSYDYKKVLKALKKGVRAGHAAGGVCIRCSRVPSHLLTLPAPGLPFGVCACTEFCCNGTVVDDPELGQVCVHALRRRQGCCCRCCCCDRGGVL